MKRILLVIILFTSLLQNQNVVAGEASARQVSREEIEALFKLATARPTKIHIVAHLEITDTPWTKAQIESELKLQNDVMQSQERRLSSVELQALQTARSNAIVRNHSGFHLKHVEEWYSGTKYRLDKTDESAVTERFLTNKLTKYHDTFVNILDKSFSQYTSFTINRELKDIQLTQDPAKRYAPNDLWKVMGLDEPVSLPLIVALTDPRSMQPLVPGVERDISQLSLDQEKLKIILQGKDPMWRFESTEERLGDIDAVKIVLIGQFPDLGAVPEPALVPINVSYWVTQNMGKLLCHQATFTNLSRYTSFVCTRGKFDSEGIPYLWTATDFDGNNNVVKRMRAVFEVVDPITAFDDMDIFMPESNVRSNFIVADLTSGSAKIIQNPHPEIVSKNFPTTNEKKRTVLLCILGIMAILPLVIYFARTRRRNT